MAALGTWERGLDIVLSNLLKPKAQFEMGLQIADKKRIINGGFTVLYM